MQHLKISPKRLLPRSTESRKVTQRRIARKVTQRCIAFSSILKRSDDQSLNAKGKKVNELLEDELSTKGMDIIDNNNILYSNLWKDGLHLNDGGVRKFSAHVSKFAKYC